MEPPRLAINRIHHPVTSLGPGRRVAVWTQGCSIGCKGCASRDTWAARPDRAVTIDWLIELMRPDGVAPDGVTITGGEPFDQPEGLAALVQVIRAEWPDADVLCFSGYPIVRLRRRHAALLGLLDAVISGPFRADLPTDLVWRGSANQELVPLSPRGARIYRPHVERRTARPDLQVVVDDGVSIVGVPRAGDLERLEDAVLARGVRLEEASWRA